jgi:hypothetical protein
MHMDWKAITQMVSQLHKDEGGAVVPIVPGGGGYVLVNLVPPLVVGREELHARRDLRQWIHKMGERKRMFTRPGAVLWSIVDGGRSLFGVGAWVSVGVAERLNQKDPDRFMVCSIAEEAVL